MRDAVIFARRRIPSVALVTEAFRNQADFVAVAIGMPSIPRHVLPHPTAGMGESRLAELARAIAPALLAKLEGVG